MKNILFMTLIGCTVCVAVSATPCFNNLQDPMQDIYHTKQFGEGCIYTDQYSLKVYIDKNYKYELVGKFTKSEFKPNERVSRFCCNDPYGCIANFGRWICDSTRRQCTCLPPQKKTQ